MAVTFEYAGPDDIPGLVEIVRKHFEDVQDAQIQQALYDVEKTRSLVLRKDGGEVLGVAAFRVHEEADFADLMFFCTTTQRKGLGRALLQQLKQEVAETGDAHYLLLYSGHDAVDFWKKHGFVEGVADLPAEMVRPRMEFFDNAVPMGFDLTAEFESEAAAVVRKAIRPGDQVMVRHGHRFPTWRQAWVIDTTDKKVLAEYIDGRKQKEWVPFGSKRLLTDAMQGDAVLAQEPPVFGKQALAALQQPKLEKRLDSKKRAATTKETTSVGVSLLGLTPVAKSKAKGKPAASKAIAKAALKAKSKAKGTPAVSKAIAKATPKKAKTASPEKKQKTPPKWAPAGGYVSKRGRAIVHK